MIARIALLLVSIPLLVHGADGLYHSLRSRSQAVISCEAFAQQRPASRWVRITGCDADYLRAGYRESGGRITELLLPMTAPDVPAGGPVSLIASSTDPEVLALTEQAVRGPGATSQNAFLLAMLQVVTETGAAREVVGLARSPLEMARTRGALDAIRAPRAPNVVVVDLGRRPGALLPGIAFVAGLQALLLAVLLSMRARRRTPVDRPEGAPEGIPAVGVDAATRQTPEFRRLMLVNLPPNAAAAELENATPLGSQHSVRSALAQVLPGITFNDHGLGQFNHADHTMLFDLGDGPQVWTATVDVTGDSAPEALRDLIMQTGWRAYAPRLGRFITAADLKRDE
jgi:hypothetical protein